MHACQWPISEKEECGQPAHHCMESDKGAVFWLCGIHYDSVGELLKAISKWDDPAGELMRKIIRKNRL